MLVLLQEDAAGVMLVLLEDGSPTVLSVGTVSMLSARIASISSNGSFKSISIILLGSSHVVVGGEALILVLDTHLNWQSYREFWGKVERDGRVEKVAVGSHVPSECNKAFRSRA